MSQPVETIDHGNLVIEIYEDESPQSPRGDDNFGTIAAWHRRYKLGDKGFDNLAIEPSKFVKDLEASGAVYLPLYLYDHSGITISTGSFGDPWDSGQVGVIFAPMRKVNEEFDSLLEADRKAAAIKLMKAEVETFDQFLRGDVYGYQIKSYKICPTCNHREAEVEDSCWGYFGLEDCKQEAIGVAESIVKFQAEQVKDSAGIAEDLKPDIGGRCELRAVYVPPLATKPSPPPISKPCIKCGKSTPLEDLFDSECPACATDLEPASASSEPCRECNQLLNLDDLSQGLCPSCFQRIHHHKPD